MALQGVETGSINPRLAPIVAPSAGSRGSAPCAFAMAMTTGTTMLADAVLEVASDTTTATTTDANSNPVPPLTGSSPVSPRPTASANPVWNDSTPSANPPP